MQKKTFQYGIQHMFLGLFNLKNIISVFNDRCFMMHENTSAAKDVIPKLHQQDKNHVFEKIKQSFSEEPFDELTYVPAIKGEVPA